ncbi:MAG: hypothetical protein U0L59_00835 [Faecalimonas sp.]|nr:hypothetical protein [Faecalimonas sp.]
MKRISLNNRIWVIPMTCLFLFMGICFSIRDTYSRYLNEIYSVTTYKADAHYQWKLSDGDIVGAEKSRREIPSTPVTSKTGVKLLQHPSPNSPLIVQLTYPEGYDEIAISLNGSTFPSGTSYSFDGVEQYQLQETGYIALTGETIFAMAFPDDLLQVGQSATLGFYFFGEGKETTLVDLQIKKVEDEAIGVTLQGTAKPILEEKGSLSWNIRKMFDDMEYTVRLEYLSADGYVQIPVADSLKSDIVSNDDGSVTVTLSNAKANQALAGTYRMVVAQTGKLNGNTCQLQSICIPFFVYYR